MTDLHLAFACMSLGKAEVPDVAQKLKCSLNDLSTITKETLNGKSYILGIQINEDWSLETYIIGRQNIDAIKTCNGDKGHSEK